MANKLALLFLLGNLSLLGQQRIIIFANGYLGPKYDNLPRDNGISQEPRSYWYKYDDTLIKRFEPVLPLYVSGHHSLKTSPHRSKFKVGFSYLLTRFLWFPCKKGVGLNTRLNPEGFMTRYKNGQICGKNFLTFAKDSLSSNPKLDTLDFVCHSMGYAYILGFLTQVDSIYTLGKILIFSPESPSFMGYDWNRFQEVWQIGSNQGEKHGDPICLQDGIAPQSAVKGIENISKNKGGRVFVPKDVKRGFNRSHHLGWYSWFYRIKPGDPGYFGR